MILFYSLNCSPHPDIHPSQFQSILFPHTLIASRSLTCNFRRRKDLFISAFWHYPLSGWAKDIVRFIIRHRETVKSTTLIKLLRNFFRVWVFLRVWVYQIPNRMRLYWIKTIKKYVQKVHSWLNSLNSLESMSFQPMNLMLNEGSGDDKIALPSPYSRIVRRLSQLRDEKL